jgi:hypothetical protein
MHLHFPKACCCLILVVLVGTGCDRIAKLSDHSNIEVTDQLSRLQIAILEDAGLDTSTVTEEHGESVVSAANHSEDHSTDPTAASGFTRLAVLTVVDQSLFDTDTPAGDTEDDPAKKQAVRDAALRRERQVRQAINARLVRNTLIRVVQPSAEDLATARAELIGNDSAPLSQQSVRSMGELLQVEYIINVLIDREGQDVDIVAQHTADGAIVFQETRNWTGRLRLAEVQPTAE